MLPFRNFRFHLTYAVPLCKVRYYSPLAMIVVFYGVFILNDGEPLLVSLANDDFRLLFNLDQSFQVSQRFLLSSMRYLVLTQRKVREMDVLRDSGSLNTLDGIGWCAHDVSVRCLPFFFLVKSEILIPRR